MPFSDCDSTCSMLFTVVLSVRSVIVTIRPAIWSAESPVYCQTILTTGILIFGKMSVGVRRIVTGPIISNKMDNTTKVYGRLKAKRTIHIKISLRSVQRSAIGIVGQHYIRNSG